MFITAAAGTKHNRQTHVETMHVTYRDPLAIHVDSAIRVGIMTHNNQHEHGSVSPKVHKKHCEISTDFTNTITFKLT